MSPTLEARLSSVEAELDLASRRLERLEGSAAPVLVSSATAAARPSPTTAVSVMRLAAASRTSAHELNLEELLGGRLLAIVGGLSVLIGLSFFVALAIDHGWIGEVARVAIAFAGSGLLFLAGTWLGEKRGRTQASLALAGTGLGGAFLALTAASAHYGLLPLPLALVAASLIGALGAAVAIRWDSRTLAGLALLGSLAAPVLVGAERSLLSCGSLLVAFAAVATVLVWRRWEWLRIGAFAIVMPQIAWWALTDSPRAVSLVLVLGLVSLLNLAAALGFELRLPPAALRPSTALLVTFGALVAAAVGALALHAHGGLRADGLWVGALAVAHVLVGLASTRSRRVSDEIGALLLATGLLAADAAFPLLVDGPALTFGWAASAVALAFLARRGNRSEPLLKVGLCGQLALAAAHALAVDVGGSSSLDPLAGGAAALVAIGLGALASARLAWAEGDKVRIGLDGLSVAAFAYLTALLLDGAPLVLAWAGEAVALAELSRRSGDRSARLGSLALLALAAGHALIVEAPPSALVYGVASLGAATLALGIVVCAAASVALAWPILRRRERIGLASIAALVLVYLGSVAIVDLFQPGAGVLATGLALGVRQQGQAALTSFWTLCGLLALSVGLTRGLRSARLAGFAFLGLATAKVFLYDLSTLGSTWRVLSFVVLGLVLLVAALAYQRLHRNGKVQPS